MNTVFEKNKILTESLKWKSIVSSGLTKSTNRECCYKVRYNVKIFYQNTDN